MTSKTYSVHEVSQLTGLSRDTLYYYEKIGLLKKIHRDDHNYRKYTAADLDLLQIIMRFREMGIPINDLVGFSDLSYAELLAYFTKYNAQLKEQIKKLETLSTFFDQKIELMEIELEKRSNKKTEG